MAIAPDHQAVLQLLLERGHDYAGLATMLDGLRAVADADGEAKGEEKTGHERVDVLPQLVAAHQVGDFVGHAIRKSDGEIDDIGGAGLDVLNGEDARSAAAAAT